MQTRSQLATGFLLLVLALAFAPGAFAASFEFPGHGTLTLDVPASWHAQLEQPGDDLPPTIRLSDGDSLLLVTALWSPDDDKGFNDERKLHDLMEENGTQLLPSARESELTLSRVEGAACQGYYYFLTDKDPGPGEYEYLSRGGIGTGDLLLVVTYLSHAKDLTTYLEIIRSAQHGHE